MDEGWILDVHPDRDSESMVVWLKCDDGTVSGYRVRWSPTLHVSGEGDRLRLLGSRLQRMVPAVSGGPEGQDVLGSKPRGHWPGGC